MSRSAVQQASLPATVSQVRRLSAPMFEIGPKNLMRLAEIVELAVAAGRAGETHGVSVVVTVPTALISRVSSAAPNVFVFAQEMSVQSLGASVGRTTAESLVDAGAHGVMLNHDSNPLDAEALAAAVERAHDNGLLTMVCAGSDTEARTVFELQPTIVLYEPPELIGTAGGADRPWIAAINREAATVVPETLMMHAGGVAVPDDAYRIMSAGAHATGATSGVIRAASPSEAAAEFIAATRKGFDAARAQHSR